VLEPPLVVNNKRSIPHYPVCDAERDNSGAQRLDSSNLGAKLVDVVCWTAVGDENHQAFSVCTVKVCWFEDSHSCQSERARCVRMLAAIRNSVDGC